jgi:HEAT repeat protein
MTEIVPFTTVIKSLLDEENLFPAKYLHHFSDIQPDHLKSLKEVWSQIKLSRKHSLLEDLENLAEKDTLLSFDNLAYSLLEDPDAMVRTLAIRLLWESEDAGLIPIYLSMLNSDSSGSTSAAAASALGRFVYMGEVDHIPSSTLRNLEENLIKAVRESKDSQIRRRSLESLGFSSRPDVKGLITTAYYDPDPDWIISALIAMGRSNNQGWEKEVIAHLHHENDDIRIEAIQTAGQLEFESARVLLLEQLEEDEDPEVWHALLWSLSQIGGEGVREGLEEFIDLIDDADEDDFLDEVLENLNLTDQMASFSLFDLDGSDDNENELSQNF